MVADMLFHPEHIVPLVKFVPAPAECADHRVARFFMEAHAAVGEPRVFRFAPCDAGIAVEYMLTAQDIFKSCVQASAKTGLPAAMLDIDGRLNGPSIGIPCLESPGIGITDKVSA